MTAELEKPETDLDSRCPAAPPLYIDVDELRRRINPKIGRDRFRLLIREKMANAGFPPCREIWGGWYWPKVKQWLDNDNEVATDGSAAGVVQDGPENFDATPKRQTRLQTRPASVAVLDSQAGRGRSDGIPRQVHSVGSRGR